jgi:hypothetical protein
MGTAISVPKRPICSATFTPSLRAGPSPAGR